MSPAGGVDIVDSEWSDWEIRMQAIDQKAREALQAYRSMQWGLAEAYYSPLTVSAREAFRLPRFSPLTDIHAKAVARIVGSHYSADPRNAELHSLLVQMHNLSLQYGETLRDSHYFADARRYALDMSGIVVSNPEQKALFVYDGLLAYADALFYEAHVFSYAEEMVAGIDASGTIDADLVKTMVMRNGQLHEVMLREDQPLFDLLVPADGQPGKYALPENYFAVLDSLKLRELRESFLELVNKVRFVQARQVREEIILLYEVLLGEKEPDEVKVVSKEMEQMLALVTERRGELDKLLKRSPIYRARALARCGNLMWWGTEDKQYHAAALKKYEEALRIDPYNVEALIGRASLYLKKEKNPNEALRLAVRALRRMASGEADWYVLSAFKRLFVQFDVESRKKLGPREQLMVQRAREIIGSREELTGEDFRQVLEIFREL
jgi:tetratricopeptide (TPR) repeat protein